MADHPPLPEAPPSPASAYATSRIAAVVVVLAGAFVAYGLLSAALAPRRIVAPDALPPASVGKVAPAFTLPSLRGTEKIGLADFRGKVVVLNFFASWCAPCELEAADLQQTWQEVTGRDVVFLGVAIQDEYTAAQGFLKKHGITYPAVFDARSEAMQALRVTGIPTTIVIDAQGRIVSRFAGIFVGDAGRAALRERIEAARRLGP